MWLVALAGIASADQAAMAPTDCGPPSLVGTVPLDGDLGLPPETVLTLAFSDDGCGDPSASTVLRTAAGAFVSTTVERDGNLIRVVPDAPLEAGEYLADVTVDGWETIVVGFRIGLSTTTHPPDEPAEVVLSAGRRCEPMLSSRVEVVATFPAAAWTDRGVLRATVLTEDGEAATRSLPYWGEGEVTQGFDVLGGEDLCVVLALDDVTGATAWELEPVCAEPAPPCPEDDGHGIVSGVLGCSTAPLGGVLLLPLVLLATRRRGLAAAAALAGCDGPKDTGEDTGLIPFTTTVTVEHDAPTTPVDPPATSTTDTGTPTDPVAFVPTDVTVPPAELAGERTWCWTLSERDYTTWLYAVGGDSGTVVEVSPWPGNGELPVTALAVHDGRLIGARSLLWIAYDLQTGSSAGGNMDAGYEAGLAVVGTDLVAIAGGELRVYPDPWALVTGDEAEVRPGFDGLETFTADGGDLIGTELWAQALTVVDAATGALVSTTPLSVGGVHVDGLSLADGVLHLLDAEQVPARLLQVDPATGAELARVELVASAASFDPGGLWCEPHG